MNNTSSAPNQIIDYVIGTPFDHLPSSGISLRQIGSKGQIVRTRVTKDGQKFARITDRTGTYAVPSEICRMAAGKDAWMRQILFRCSCCKARTRAEDMEAADLCPTCWATEDPNE